MRLSCLICHSFGLGNYKYKSPATNPCTEDGYLLMFWRRRSILFSDDDGSIDAPANSR